MSHEELLRLTTEQTEKGKLKWNSTLLPNDFRARAMAEGVTFEFNVGKVKPHGSADEVIFLTVRDKFGFIIQNVSTQEGSEPERHALTRLFQLVCERAAGEESDLLRKALLNPQPTA